MTIAAKAGIPNEFFWGIGIAKRPEIAFASNMKGFRCSRAIAHSGLSNIAAPKLLSSNHYTIDTRFVLARRA